MEMIRFKSEGIVGRQNEIVLLQSALDELEQGKGKTILVSGEAGIGKTELINKVCEYALAKEVNILKSACTSQLSHPYQPFIDALATFTTEKIIYEAEEEEDFTLIDEIFLVNNAGVPMAHISRKGRTLDEQIIGSMLSAVQDFVKDSFGDASRVSALDRLDYGTKKILIEHGRYIFIACVIEGELHNNLRIDLKNAVEYLEKTYCDILSAWDGDLSKIEDIHKHLISLSLKKYRIRRALEGDKLEAKRIQLYECVTQMLVKHLEKPMLLLIEDIHWAEEASLLMLQYIARNTKNSSVLICCTYRSSELTTRIGKILEDMKETGLAEELFLKPLSKPDITKMIKSFFHNSNFSEEFFNDIYEKSGGNPFYAKELIHMLYAEKTIQNIDGKWQINPIVKLKLPTTVVEVVSRRLNKLKAEEVRIVECAATLGKESTLSLLSMCLDVEKNKLILPLANIEAYKILHLKDKENMVYQFEHAITQEVIYEGMSERWRRLTHQRIGLTLEEINKNNPDEVVYQLAHHFYKGGVTEKAINYSIKAGEKSNNQYAVEKAVEYYKNALDALGTTGDIEAKKKTLEVLSVTGELSGYIGNRTESLDYYNQLVSLSEELNEKYKLAEGYRNIGDIYNLKAEYSEAVKYLENALKVSESVNDLLGVAASYHSLGSLHWHRGDLEDASNYLIKCIKMYKKINEKRTLAKASIDLGVVSYLKGDYNQSIDMYKEAIQLSEEINDKYTMIRACLCIGSAYSMHGNLDNAIEWKEKCLKISKEIGYLRGMGYGLGNGAEDYIKIGNLHKAEEYTAKAFAIFKKLDEKRMIVQCLLNYGMIYTKKGEWNKAAQYFEESIKEADEIKSFEGLSQIYVEYANMWRDKGDFKKAKKLYEKATSIYETLGNMQKVEEVKKELEKL